MNKALPKPRRFSGIEQVQMLTQTAEREKEIHRLQHELNAANIALQDARSINKQLNEENERQSDEIVQHLSDKINQRNEITELQKEVSQLLSIKRQDTLRISKCLDALEFYADGENYEGVSLHLIKSMVNRDKGELARYVLGGSNE